MGDRAKNARSNIIHIEGDPDHPVNRGTLCPKGSALLDIVHAPTRLTAPRYRAPGSNQFKAVSWDFALDRIARLMKDDRDKNFIARNAAGTTVNRWISTGMLAASASSSETAYADLEGRALARHAGLRQPGACLTRTDGGQSGPNIRSRCDDQHLAGHQERQCGASCMGGNAAEAHPCGFKWVIEAKIENQAKLVVVDPRFTRTASVADMYAPIRPGTDIAFLNGLIRYLLEKDAIQHDYVRAYTSAGLIVKEGFGFEDGLFTGYNEESADYDKIELGLRARRAGLRQGRRHLAASALRDQPAAQARRPLHAGDGVAHLRHAAGQAI